MKKNIKLLIFGFILLSVLILTYSNHFDNSFHFDDDYTIVNNIYIQDIKNIPLFFKDHSTYWAITDSYANRPFVTTTLAIDYWIAGGLKPFYFHISMFLCFLIQCVLMFFLFYKIINTAVSHRWNKYIALFASGWYGLHTANAETINFISARSDSYSTLFVVAAFVIYLYAPKLRKWFIYLIPIVIGMFTKEPTAMFFLLLFVYIILFEKKVSLTSIFNNKKALWQSFIKTLPAFIVCVGLALFSIKTIGQSPVDIGISRFNYLITQPFVIIHYFNTFFLPFNLSADTDWRCISNIFDDRFIVGIVFIITMLTLSVILSKKKKYRPVSFGILWFFIALLPTSSIFPLAEVMNDHRIFFPYIGLMLSVCWALGLLIYKFEKIIMSKGLLKVGIVFLAIIILGAYAYGTFQRNKVWQDEESLWYDVTIKSPKNGRGLMNYGLSQMRKGKYEVALKYYEKALEYNPYYTSLYINIGIVKNAMNQLSEAEKNFKKAIQYGKNYHDSYYYYAQWLNRQNRNKEAIPLLLKAIELSPAYMKSRYLLMKIYADEYEWEKLNKLVTKTLQIVPDDKTALIYFDAYKNENTKIEIKQEIVKNNPTPENFLELSLSYYNAKMYHKCIEACNKALKLKPDYASAYNNICSAYNMLGKYDQAIKACEKALKIKPDFQLAKNNLNLAKQNIK
jgi:tetratricopeptide (TPR) repeat protein